MRRRAVVGGVACVWAFACAACGDVEPGPLAVSAGEGPQRSAAERECRVHEATREAQLLCDPDRFLTAASHGLGHGAASSSEINELLRLVERVWNRDESLGDGIPWEKYSSEGVRALLAEMLARYVRAGHTSVSLRELQDAADALRDRVDRGGPGLLLALRLMRAVSSPGQAPWLMRYARGPMEEERLAAVLALGSSCDAEAEEYLRELAQQAPRSDRDVAAIELATETHRSLAQRRFCDSQAAPPDRRQPKSAHT